jgi:methyl-accepting chemotaxis protein
MPEISSRLYSELRRVTEAVAGGQVGARVGLEGLDPEAAQVAAGFNRMLDCLSAPLNTATAALHSLAHGRIPDFVTDDYQGEFRRVKRDTNLCVAMMLGVLREIEELASSAKNGKLAARGNDWDFEGCWKDLITGLNELVDAFIQPFQVASRYLEMISQGVVPDRIAERYPGDLNQIRRNLNTVIQTLTGLLAEVNRLCAAAMEGRLDERAEAERYGNEFRRIVAGINGTLDAVVAPLQASARTLNRVAQGDLTVRLEGRYQGQFAALQRDINSMAERLRASMAEISTTAQELAASAEELTGISSTLNEDAGRTMSTAAMASQTSKQVAESVRVLSAGARETAGSVQEIAANVGRVSQQFESADEKAQRALGAVSQLSDASSSIMEIVKVIEGVAGETTELSAGARRQAGTVSSAGRGFAVVADEVKRLAGRIAEATDELSGRIGEMRTTLSAPASTLGNGTEIDRLPLKLARISREATEGIEDISRVAWQTRLVSLNAAIEGARAEDSANQFTNVAQEIRRLAGETTQAASNVGTLADAVGTCSREGATTIQSIAATIGELRQAAGSIAADARQRAQSTVRMGELADAAAQTAGRIVEHVKTVAEAASSTIAATRQTDREARQLSQTAVRLQELVNGFQI